MDSEEGAGEEGEERHSVLSAPASYQTPEPELQPWLTGIKAAADLHSVTTPICPCEGFPVMPQSKSFKKKKER